MHQAPRSSHHNNHHHHHPVQNPTQQQPQQPSIVYGPVANSVVAVQGCGPGVHPPSVYPAVHRSSPLALHPQGKTGKWSSKNKTARNQQQQQQQPRVQQSYSSKPVVLFEQPSNSGPPVAPASSTSFLIASSTFTHGSFPDQYPAPGVALIPQTYYKPPNLQTFCLQTGQQPDQTSQAPYYTVNGSSLPASGASSFQFPNLAPYSATFGSSSVSGPVYTIQSQLPPSLTTGTSFTSSQREKSSGWADLRSITYRSSQDVNQEPFEWTTQGSPRPLNQSSNRDESRSVEKLANAKQEEHCSDESSISFDFTIEAEKMVSALCNTTSSNDLAREETGNSNSNKIESVPLFSGAGDTASNKSTWFLDFCADYGASKSIGVQTEEQEVDGSYYPEMIRKTVYWGCTEAEILLSRGSKEPKREWLRNLSSATKTAITKSSTCFPIFAGDPALVNDLIATVLRVGNGWLVLDNYLNKQHYPVLEEKFDRELVRSFKSWERRTHDLLDRIVRTFTKLERDSQEDQDQRATEPGTSFPGDVSLYTNCDLFQRSQDAVSGSTGQGQGTSTLQQRQPSSQRDPKSKTSQGCSRFDTTQSLNAEFFHLRSKVESNQDLARNWSKERRQESFEARVPSVPEHGDSLFRYQRSLVDCQNAYTQRTPVNLDPNYPGSYPQTGLEPSYTSCGAPYVKGDQCYLSRSNDPVYIGKSSRSQFEMTAVPKTKMTLLSQIEPSVATTTSGEITANLSAWFASMRNDRPQHQQQQQQPPAAAASSMDRPAQEGLAAWLPYRPDLSRNTMDLARQLQLDGNRQLQTLQNLPNVQSTPWNACNFFSNRAEVQQVPEEYDSSEDVRIYMKPGSYNVPKKRQQRRSNRRVDNSRGGVHRNQNKDKLFSSVGGGGGSTKFPFPVVSPGGVSLEKSPKILRHPDSSGRDVAWRAACASAEILLEALNVKEAENTKKLSSEEIALDKKEFSAKEETVKEEGRRSREDLEESFCKILKREDCASSYEASEDDSGSPYRLSPGSITEVFHSGDNKNGLSKSNVRTDSWLIRTLNKAGIGRQKRRVNDSNRASSESSNSSGEEQPRTGSMLEASATDTTATTAATAIAVENEEVSCEESLPTSRIDHQPGGGRATYSETVRRCPMASKKAKPGSSVSTVVAVPGRKCQRKETDRSRLLQRARRSSTRRTSGSQEHRPDSNAPCRESASLKGGPKCTGRRREDAEGGDVGKCGRSSGWSVWYSSRRKQQLSGTALSKLAMIHRTLSQMKEADIFRAAGNGCQTVETVQDRTGTGKVFLETVGHKLRHRVYRKVEQVVKDFRRMVETSRLSHKNDEDGSRAIEVLSKRVEELFGEHFASWDLDTGLREESQTLGTKLTGQRAAAATAAAAAAANTVTTASMVEETEAVRLESRDSKH